jgi:hypothetical protein
MHATPRACRGPSNDSAHCARARPSRQAISIERRPRGRTPITAVRAHHSLGAIRRGLYRLGPAEVCRRCAAGHGRHPPAPFGRGRRRTKSNRKKLALLLGRGVQILDEPDSRGRVGWTPPRPIHQRRASKPPNPQIGGPPDPQSSHHPSPAVAAIGAFALHSDLYLIVPLPLVASLLMGPRLLT